MRLLVETLVINVVASLLATGIIALLVTWRSSLVRRVLTALAATLLGVEIRFVYPDEKAAAPAVQAALKRTDRVRIFTGRGSQFQSSLYRPIFESSSAPRHHVQILLPDPVAPKHGVDWVDMRDKELGASPDPAHGDGHLRTQVSATINYLRAHLRPNQFQLRLSQVPHFGRLILHDNGAFFILYGPDHAHNSLVYEIGRGDIYDSLSRLFDHIWSTSREVNPKAA